jgi:hypothetical protein
MKKLEGLAREMFTKFSVLETGKQGNWDYLSNERKLAWMKDVGMIASYVLVEVKKEFRPLPRGNANSVYESAYMEGVRSERTYNIDTINKVEQDLVEQLESSPYNK